MTIDEFKRVLMQLHEGAAARAGIEPAGMADAIAALPDMRLMRVVPTMPEDVLGLIERGMKTCSDYVEAKP